MLVDVGARIKQLRLIKGYSVNKLANMAGVSQSYLRDIELGSKNPTISFITLLCEQLGIDLPDFFDESIDNKLEKDPLIQKIYKLSPKQREALLHFLETL